MISADTVLPGTDPYLYDLDSGREKMLIGTRTDVPGDPRDDLQGNRQETALIGDPRDDENTFIGQLQLTMLKFHNKVVDAVKADPSLKHGSETDFEAAQRIVRWALSMAGWARLPAPDGRGGDLRGGLRRVGSTAEGAPGVIQVGG